MGIVVGAEIRKDALENGLASAGDAGLAGEADAGAADDAEGANDAGKVTFFRRGVEEAAAREGRGVQGAEAAAGDYEGKNEGASGAEDLRAECHGNSRARRSESEWKDEEVCCVGQQVKNDDERKRGVQNTG